MWHPSGEENPNFQHGRTNTPEWYIWRAMRGRCSNSNVPSFCRYGGRGIKVCERWDKGEGGMPGFVCFLADVGERPSPKHSIDRIDNDGHYEPGNVRWATLTEQMMNRRYTGIAHMPDVPVVLPTKADEARALITHFIEASRSKNTRSGYASDFKLFEIWTTEKGFTALPAAPETVALYCAELATGGKKLATIRRHCASISFLHRSAGHENPTDHSGVRATLEGISRELGAAPTKKAALTADLVAKLIRKIPVERIYTARVPAGAGLPRLPAVPAPSLAGLRDRALLLLGFAGALRRSELVALDVADIARHSSGMLVTLRKSKTDQTGQGLTKAIPHGKKLKAIEALDAWLAAAGITEGPIFRAVHGTVVLGTRLTAGQVARIIKKRCAAIGLDPKLFSGHSLRSGYASTAADHGAELGSIASHLGHSKLDTTRAYVHISDAFRLHSGRRFL